MMTRVCQLWDLIKTWFFREIIKDIKVINDDDDDDQEGNEDNDNKDDDNDKGGDNDKGISALDLIEG